MKLVTWNVNSLTVRLPQVLAWLEANQPDVLALQETKMEDSVFPAAEIMAAGYQVVYAGQKTYNGVALLARHDLSEVEMGLPGLDDPQKRFIAATVQGVRVACAYMPNGQSLDSDKYPYKLHWLQHLQHWLQQSLAAYPRLVLLGDYNIAPEDRDVHDPAAWAGQVLVSPAERLAFQAMLDLGLHDAFRLVESGPGHYTWWDYRQFSLQRNKGLRIDHALVSTALRDWVDQCHIDKQARKAERPSDHAPLSLSLRPCGC